MPNEVHDGGNRPTWPDLPASVRGRIETLLGTSVTSAVPAQGGFSPGFASTLDLTDGRRFFVKAMSDSLTPGGADIYRREAAILRQLPLAVPSARLISSEDDGEWIILVYDVVDGRNPVPSQPDQLRLMLETYSELAHVLTPSQVSAPFFEARMSRQFDSWEFADLHRQIAPGPEFEWALTHAAELRLLASTWRDVGSGPTLLHGDLRADNMILTPDGIVVVDWPDACYGAPWLDLVLAVPSFQMFPNPPSAKEIIETHPLTAAVHPDAINTVLAAAAGFFGWASLVPPPPGLPTLREFQRAQASEAFTLLRSRLAWRE